MNEFRECVTFQADFPDDAQWNQRDELLVPGGKAIAEAIISALEKHGCSCSPISQHSFYGWAFTLTSAGLNVVCILAIAEEEWLLQIVPNRLLLSRALGSTSSNEYRGLQTAIHSSLQQDARISSVLWHTRSDYENCRLNKSSPGPS